MFILNALEKQIALDTCPEYFDGGNGNLLLKILSSYLTNIGVKDFKNIDETVFTDKAKKEKFSKDIMNKLLEVVMQVNGIQE